MNEPIHVLQNIQTISYGGVETFVMNYYRNIDKSKVQFDFLVREYDNMPNNYEKEILNLGGKIYNIPTFKNGKFIIFEIIKLLKSKKEYKIIHSHSNIYSVFSLFCARYAKVPVLIAHCHNTSADKGITYPIKMMLKPFVKKLSTDRLACSIDAGKWLFKDKSFRIVPNAIDTQKFAFNEETRKNKRKELDVKDELVLINIGRFTKQKNQLYLLDIFEKTLNIHPNSKLILVGDGELKTEIVDKITAHKLNEKVLLLGMRDDIPELLSASDVFVLPSLFEGLPFTLIEAQASGIKCVVSDKVPLDAKLLDNYEIVPLVNSIEKFVKVIVTENNFDRTTAAMLASEKGYDIKKAAKKLENYYLSLLK